MAMSEKDFRAKSDQLRRALREGRITQEQYEQARSNLAEQYSAAGPDLATFETMLNKLTGSKMEQQGQIGSQRRGDIYAGGLANMMSNF